MGGKNVWGGQSTSVGVNVGFLRVVGGGGVPLAAFEGPVAAVSRGAELFVLFSASPADVVASPYVVVRRYNLSGATLAEDPTFSSGDRTRFTLTSAPVPQSVDPDGIVLGAGTLTFAVSKGPSFGLFTLAGTLSNPADFAGFGAPQLAGGCNGSVLVATVKTGATSRSRATWGVSRAARLRRSRATE